MMSTLLLISDFNVAPLAGYVRNDAQEPLLRVVQAPYGLVEPILLSDHAVWAEVGADAWALVWTRPEVVSPAFLHLVEDGVPLEQGWLDEVDQWIDGLIGNGARLRGALVPLWTLPPAVRRRGVGDLKAGGVQWALQLMNARLVQRAETSAFLHVLDTPSILASCPTRARDPKLWLMGKLPFANPIFRGVADEAKAALRALMGRAKKLVVVDLDDTLWGGSVGEVGWEALSLGGHDHVGEAHADFQRALKQLGRRGILLAIASRNEEAVALEAIDRHPEMVLRRGDFAAWRIHWGDKAASVSSIVEELNIGLQDVVFIDDHPAERARVREALPGVCVPEWPADPALYADALAGLRAFDVVQVSQEDGERTRLYADERRRRAARQTEDSLVSWLDSLELVVRAQPLCDESLQRAAQLLNKTNQMNLRTRRMSAEDLLAWAGTPGCECWTFRVSDRFGDAGLCGLLGLQADGEGGQISDYVLSCRVMGRGVEEALLHVATLRARDLGWPALRVEALSTERNKPCRDFFSRVGGSDVASFLWNTSQLFPLPAHVELCA